MPNAERYRYRVIGADGVLHDFTSPTPTASLASIWDELPSGRTEVWCEGYNGRFHAVRRQYRSFWKSAPWRPDAYPKPPRSFDESVRLGYDYLLNLPFLQTFVATGRPDPAYRLNCYPAKMHAATVRAMVRLAKKSPDRRERALLLARTAADYLLSISQPTEAPLAFFPPTYAGEKLSAKRFAGMNMLIHPAEAGSAYVALYGVTQEAKYLAAAENIAKTYMRLQGADGTWYLKLWEKDGTPVNENRLLPMSVINFFDDLAAVTGKAEYTAVADRAFGSYEAGPIRTWNWEGQFEDVAPDAAYVNLQCHAPLQVARRLLRRWPKDPARVQLARELVAIVEDQFCYWERPYKRERLSLVGPKWEDWEVEPVVVEQYHYREVTDSSTAALAGAFAALARVTGDAVARGKARTLGEA